MGTRSAKRVWEAEPTSERKTPWPMSKIAGVAPMSPLKEIRARVSLSERLEAESMPEGETHKCGCVRVKSQVFCSKHGKY